MQFIARAARESHLESRDTARVGGQDIGMSALIKPGIAPTIVHVVYRFDTGGLENGLVNLLNHMAPGAYRHVVVSLTTITDFRQRVLRSDVEFVALDKPPGHGVWLYPRLYRLFRQLRPDIVHTRNLAALECVVPAWAAGVAVRVHGEHGRDVEDLDGASRKYQWLRRLYTPWVSHYVTLSDDLDNYLQQRVHVRADRRTRIYNGVDTLKFQPAQVRNAPPGAWPFAAGRHWVVGTVGRMQAVKDQLTLARAFVQAVRQQPVGADRLRLVMVGDGPLLAQVRAVIDDAGMASLCWLPGARDDVAEVMQGLDCFVLPSLAEGISNTILEAMATALPVIATNVGGNPELVDHDNTGLIVPAADVSAMAWAIQALAADPERALAMGRAGRARVEAHFSLQAMVHNYTAVYDRLLTKHGSARSAVQPTH